jgi:hypothetical protein
MKRERWDKCGKSGNDLESEETGKYSIFCTWLIMLCLVAICGKFFNFKIVNFMVNTKSRFRVCREGGLNGARMIAQA